MIIGRFSSSLKKKTKKDRKGEERKGERKKKEEGNWNGCALTIALQQRAP